MTKDNEDALRRADELEAFPHVLLTVRRPAAAHLRRLVQENEKLREWKDDAARLALDNLQLIAQNEALEADNASLRRINEAQDAKLAEQDALLRRVLDDVSGAKLCEVNSVSSRAEASRLLDKATDAIRQHLEGRA